MSTYAMKCCHCGCINDCDWFVEILGRVLIDEPIPHHERPCEGCWEMLTPAGWVDYEPAEAWGWVVDRYYQPCDLLTLQAWNVPETAEIRKWREEMNREDKRAINEHKNST